MKPNDEAAPVLVAQGLGYDYGRYTAVAAVDLTLRSRGIHALIGPNGAGKTTFFNIVSGQLPASRGRLHFEGRDVTGLAPHHKVRLGMARSFQITSLFAGSTVRHNLHLAALGVDRWQPHRFWRRWEPGGASALVDGVLRRLQLLAHADAPVAALSHGLQRVVEIGMCLVARPRVLLLDEPLAGLGLSDIPRIADLLRDLRRDHAILLVEHNMRVVMSISDEITVMFQGKVLCGGAPSAVRADPEVRRVYLGSS